MKVIFRVDSGSNIGGGHLSRCLTIATLLFETKNIQCSFIMRAHCGNFAKQVKSAGFGCALLPLEFLPDYYNGDYSQWIGASWENDAASTVSLLEEWQCEPSDILIVDHYGLDYKWESATASAGIQIGVIDDLVNRPHHACFLLDQTCSRKATEYSNLINNDAELFTGEKYCLLRPEFKRHREDSLKRRKGTINAHNIFINFGSTDPHNHTTYILLRIAKFVLHHNSRVVVVISSGCAHIEKITDTISLLPYQCELIIDANNIAELMVQADIAIGAAGATTWERCALGVPSIIIQTADNQADVIKRVTDCGAAHPFKIDQEETENTICDALEKLLICYDEVSAAASELVDAGGAYRIVDFLVGRNLPNHSSLENTKWNA